MGITILSLRAMLPPLQNLLAWFAAAPAGAQHRPASQSATRESRRPLRACAVPVRQHHHPRPGRALRVVRVAEGQQTRGAGRMVISGRMADVCAELERLAALESAAR